MIGCPATTEYRQSPAPCLLLSFLCLLFACSGGEDDKKEKPADAVDAVQAETTVCVDGEPCDDGDPCTFQDWCVDGECVGAEKTQCQVVVCADAYCDDAGGCIYDDIEEGWCLVAETCYQAGEQSTSDPCRMCDPEQSQTKFSDADTGTTCEDGNVCTENDFCDSGDCLAGSPPTCADGIQCTIDACDPDAGCHHEPDHEGCSDKNACTTDVCQPDLSEDATGCAHIADDDLSCADGNVCTIEHCDDGVCIIEPEPVSCEDGNPCTDEVCHESYGCLYVFNDVECDDGESCTENDVCHFGKCAGDESWWDPCPACDLTFSDHVVKMFKLRVGDGGYPGEALNVDNDLKTCSPDGNCEQGLDNSLMLAGDFIDQTIEENLANAGDDVSPLIFVAELVGPSFGGEEFVMNLYYAGLSSQNPECNFMEEICIYQASSLNFNPLCVPQITFDNAHIEDGVLTAGGSGYIFPFKMNFVNGKKAEVVLYSAGVEADVVIDEDVNVIAVNGVFGGAVTKENIIELIEAIPEQYLPIPVETIVGLVDNIPQDIDLDGDGTMDGSSIAFVFESLPGILEPYYN